MVNYEAFVRKREAERRVLYRALLEARRAGNEKEIHQAEQHLLDHDNSGKWA